MALSSKKWDSFFRSDFIQNKAKGSSAILSGGYSLEQVFLYSWLGYPYLRLRTWEIWDCLSGQVLSVCFISDRIPIV